MARTKYTQKKSTAKRAPIAKTAPVVAKQSSSPISPAATTPAPLKAREIIDRNELKEAIEASLKRQIVYYAPNGPIVTNAGIEKDARRDGTEIPDTMDVNNWLEWQHVYGAIPILVAERPHLRENVGVFPPYNLNRMKELLESRVTTKLIQDAGIRTRLTANGDTIIDEPPLASLNGLTARQKDIRNKEEKRRNDAERTRYAQATELLRKNNLSEEKAFQLYLEALSESKENFLGNPYKKDLALGNCSQLIIPFNFNNTHFAVSVVNFVTRANVKIAEIKHYDSMGSDLRETLKLQLIAYCTSLGFEPRYRCISQHDQRFDGHNCGIFASFKAIDIANENANNPERLLDNLGWDNYHQIMNAYRYVITLKLKEFGINIASSPQLTTRIKQQQENFERASVYSQQSGLLNGLLLEIKHQLETGIAQVKGIQPTQNSVQTKPLPDISSRNLFNECLSLSNEAIAQLKTLEQKPDKNEEDKTKINMLQGLISMFKTVAGDFNMQIAGIERRNRSYFSWLGLNRLSQWVAGQNWSMLALTVPLGCLAILFGVPVITSLIMGIGSLLGANVALPLLVGGVIIASFTAGGLISYTLSNLLIEENSTSAESLPVANEDEIPELSVTHAMRRQLEETIAAIPSLPAIPTANTTSPAAQPVLAQPIHQKQASQQASAGSGNTGPGESGPSVDRRVTRSASRLAQNV